MHTETPLDWRGSGALLNIRGHSEAALAFSLAKLAAAMASDLTGSPVESAVALLRPETALCTAATDDGAGELSRWEHRTGQGPTARAVNGGLSIILNEHCKDPRWPGYPASLRRAGFRSAVAIPLELKRGYRAALTFYAVAGNVFTPAVAARLLAFSDVAAKSLALALQIRADLVLSSELRTALASRKEVDTACGVIMVQDQCSYDEALGALTQAARTRSLGIRGVAQSIILSLAGDVPASGSVLAMLSVSGSDTDAATHDDEPAVMQEA